MSEVCICVCAYVYVYGAELQAIAGTDVKRSMNLGGFESNDTMMTQLVMREAGHMF